MAVDIKANWIMAAQIAATTIAQQEAKALALYEAYTARGFGSGGANPITDAEAAVYGLTAAEVQSLSTALYHLSDSAYWTTYKTIIGKARTDM